MLRARNKGAVELEEDKMIDVHQAAKKLGVSTATVYRMLDDGRIGGTAWSGIGSRKRTIKISEASIELLKTESRLLSQYEEKKYEQLRLFA